MKEELKKIPKWVLVILAIFSIVIIFLVVYIIMRNSEDLNQQINNNLKQTEESVKQTEELSETYKDLIDEESEIKNNYSLDKAFTFDDLEIIVSSKISIVKNNDEYSDNYGKNVVKIPITVKNLKNETHSLNMFYFKIFGSKGIEVNDEADSFDDSIDYAGELRKGASYTRYFYYLYDGDGTYTIEFDDFSQKIDIDFEVKK